MTFCILSEKEITLLEFIVRKMEKFPYAHHGTGRLGLCNNGSAFLSRAGRFFFSSHLGDCGPNIELIVDLSCISLIIRSIFSRLLAILLRNQFYLPSLFASSADVECTLTHDRFILAGLKEVPEWNTDGHYNSVEKYRRR